MEEKDRYIRMIKERRSIRDFTVDAPSDEDILRIIEAAGYAPSPTNLQPWKFIVVKNRRKIEEMASAVKERIAEVGREASGSISRMKKSILGDKDYFDVHFTFFRKAPVVIVPLYKLFPSHVYSRTMNDEDVSGLGKDLSVMSVSAATQNLLLACHGMGLGGCWMHGPLIAEKEIREILSINKPWEILAIVPIGVPAAVPGPPRRKKLEHIAKFIR